MTFLILFLGFFVTSACDNFQSFKSIELSDGRSVRVKIDKSADPVVLVAFLDSKKSHTTVRRVQRDAFDVWNQLEPLAEARNINEGLLNYVVIGVDGKEQRFLFTAEKIETGEWVVRAAN